MKIFLDTNVWLRFFLKDVVFQFEHCLKLISQIEEGRLQAYTSTIVILEVNYVIGAIYKFKFEQITEVLETILKVRGITILEKTNLKLALSFYKKYKIKLSDCLIVSQIPKDIILVTFDKELLKIAEITVKNPGEIILG